MNVTMVPSASAIGAGSMSSTAPPPMPTRDGGRCVVPVVASREPTKPYFQSLRRRAAEEEGRLGAGRFGGWTSSRPRQER